MQYMGGKSRIAGHVHDVIEGHRKPEHDLFIEPFMGGANISAKVAPTFKKAYLSDSNRYVVAMWKALADGWEPPTTVPKTKYLAARRGELPDHEIGYILTAYGFQGRFDASYMDNPGSAKARNAMRQAKKLASAPPPRESRCAPTFPLDELPPVFTEIAHALAGLTLCGWIPTDDDHPRAQNQNLVQVRTREGVPGLLSCVWPQHDEVGEQLRCGPVWFADEVTLWEADQMNCKSMRLQAGMCQVSIRIGENATFDLFASHTKLLARDAPLLQLFSRDVFVSTQKTVTTTQEKP